MTESKNKQVQDASPSQHDCFVETAKALGADKDDGTLDRVLGKVAPPVRPKKQDAAVRNANDQGRLVPK